MLNDKPESVDILDTATTVSITSMSHVSRKYHYIKVK